ncbi:hypothetical protein AOLI_G00024140 [Acnodon oligacanthus]
MLTDEIAGHPPSRHWRKDPHALSHVRLHSLWYTCGHGPLKSQSDPGHHHLLWLNQSHNACVNYCNRNASKPTPFSKFFQGYLGAVSSTVTIAVGLNVLIQRAKSFRPATRLLVQRFVPFPAVASANVCNVLLMRHSELSEGVSVLDENGNVASTSKIAARCISSTAETPSTLAASTQPSVSLCFRSGPTACHQSISTKQPDSHLSA